MSASPAGAHIGRSFAAMFAREFALAFRRPGDLATPVFFFVIVCALFPLALSPAHDVLRLIGP
ncbi:MAG: heme exporter protein CcmB, partial [Pseudomonadota bacterium]